MTGGNVIDKTNPELVEAGIFDSKENDVGKLNENTEQAINMQVEASFSSFLNDTSETEKTQKKFNEWLDSDVNRILSLSANKAVKENTQDVEIKLKSLDFEIQLAVLQQNVLNNNETTQTIQTAEVAENEKIKAGDLNIWHLFNGVEINNIITSVNEIKDKDIFDKMSGFLKLGTQPEIKKFQLEMLDVLKPQEEAGGSRLESTWNDVKNTLKGDPLGNGGVDGKFGPDTLKALEDYVVAVNEAADNGSSTSTATADQTGNQNSAGTNNNSSTGAANSGGTNGNNSGAVNNNASSGGVDQNEIVNNAIDYKMKDKYAAKQGDTITLAENVVKGKREVYPKDDDVKFENGKLIYKSDNVGEETFTLSLEDDKGKRQKKTMTVEVEEKVEDVKNENERKTAYDKYKNLPLKLGSNYKKNKESLNVAMKGLKQDYQDLDREIDYLEVINNQWDSLKSNFNYESVVVALTGGITDLVMEAQLRKDTEKLIINKLISKVEKVNIDGKNNIEAKLLKPKQKEQREIEELTDELLNKEASESLSYLMTNSIDDFGSKLNDECVYYFDGKYLSQDKFIRKLKRGKISKSDVHQVGLNVDFKGTNTKDYLKSDVGNLNRNWEIKSLTLTDDLSVAQNGLTHNVDVQYKALGYGDMEIQDRSLSDKRALKRILGITGLFGMGGTDEDLSIADQNYDVGYEKEGLFSRERKQLKKLKRVLLRLSDDDNLKNAFKKAMFVKSEADINKMKGNKLDKDIIKLSELYLLSKNADQPMPQLERSLGLLENYFVRGIDSTTSFEDIYDKENIGTMDGLIDPDKKRKVVRKMFKGEYFEGLEDFPKFENSKELRELKRMVKKIDLADFFQGNNRSKGKYKKFNELYSIYSSNKIDNLKDENDNVVVGSGLETDEGGVVECTQAELYYNAVFDFLVGVGEGNQNIVESINSLKVSKGISNVEVGADEYWYGDREITKGENSGKYTWTNKENPSYSPASEKQFMLQIADLNSDGRSDFADGGLRMGMEIKNIYKDVKLDQMSGVESNDKPAWQNIVEFAKDFFQKTGKTALLDDLDALGGKNEEEITLEKLNAEIAKNPGLLNAFQEMLVNSPIPLEYIYRYGSDAAEKYLSNPNTDLMYKLLSGKIEVAGVKVLLDEEIEKLVAEGLEEDKIPELRSVLKPMLYGALIRNGGIMTGAAGVGLTLNTKNAGNFSLNLGYTDMPTGGAGSTGTLGVMMSWGDSWKVGADTKMIGGVGTGVIGFVPVASGAVGISTLMNKSKITKDSLKPSSATYFNANGHLAIVGGLPVIGAGVGMSFDKIEGINRKYDVIKNQLGGRNGIINQVLENVTWGGSKTDALIEIKNQIAKKFYQGKFDSIKSDEEKIMVGHAAENIYRGLSYYNIDAQTSPLTQDVKNTIVHDMAENYAVQWKNNAVKSNIDDVHVDGFGVGVSFLAGFMPIPYAHVSIAEYKNLYYTETKKSVSDYYSQLSTGVGMEHIDDAKFYNKNGITPYAIAYLNAKMNIAHPGIDNPDLDIKLSYDIEDDVPVFEQEDDELPQALYIPKDLCNYANINISSDMEQYVNIEKAKNEELDMVDYIVVPVDSKISLLSRSGGNDGRFNLIIGDTKAELDDVLIDNQTSKSDLTGNPANFEGGMNEQYVNIDNVNDEITGMSEVTLGDDVITNPLISCENDVNGELVFNLNQNITAKCLDMGGANSELSIDKLNNKMMMPQIGTLTMRYVKAGNGDEKYEMYYSSNPNDRLDIKFDAEGDLDATQSIGAVTWEAVPGSGPFGGDVFEVISKDVDGLFTDKSFVEGLHKIDDTKKQKYDEFLDNASEDLDKINGDFDINDSEYSAAAEILKIILGSDSQYDAINAVLSGTDIEKKSLLINRMKGIMAYNPVITNGKSLKTVLKSHGNSYEKLTGPNEGSPVGALLNGYRKKVFDELIGRGEEKLKRDEVEPNLFGYTAFYRYGAKAEEDGRNFSMTAPGDTKVLGGYKEKITDDASKEWFMENFKLNKITQNVVTESIISQLEGLDNQDKVGISKYIKANLIKLMESDGKELDIPGEKYKITLDMGYYFYLLGECANESIGVKLNGITVRKHKKVVPNTGGSSAEVSIDASNTGGLYVDSVEALNQAGASKRSALIGAAFVDKTPNEEPPDNPGSDPDPGEPGDDPGSDPGDGEPGDDPGSDPGSGGGGGSIVGEDGEEVIGGGGGG